VRIRLQTAVAALGALGAGAALVISGEDARRAADQAWPAFVLVTGLLLVGVVAHHDGVFEWAAEALVGLPGSGVTLTAGALGLVAVVTALLNLDTSVVFLTPVLILGARRRAMDERTLLYGAVFMSNAASLFLPGSNLTNLLVLAQRHVSGADFAGEMLPGAVASVVITAVALGIIHRRHLGTSRPSRRNTREQLRGRLGLAASVVAAALSAASTSDRPWMRSTPRWSSDCWASRWHWGPWPGAGLTPASSCAMPEGWSPPLWERSEPSP